MRVASRHHVAHVGVSCLRRLGLPVRWRRGDGAWPGTCFCGSEPQAQPSGWRSAGRNRLGPAETRPGSDAPYAGHSWAQPARCRSGRARQPHRPSRTILRPPGDVARCRGTGRRPGRADKPSAAWAHAERATTRDSRTGTALPRRPGPRHPRRGRMGTAPIRPERRDRAGPILQDLRPSPRRSPMVCQPGAYDGGDAVAGTVPHGVAPSGTVRATDEMLHSQRIRRSYCIASKETTVRQFQRFLRENPQFADASTKPSRRGAGWPQTSVTWYEAAAYCNWLSQKEGISSRPVVLLAQCRKGSTRQECRLPPTTRTARLSTADRSGMGIRLPRRSDDRRYFGNAESALRTTPCAAGESKRQPLPVGSASQMTSACSTCTATWPNGARTSTGRTRGTA